MGGRRLVGWLLLGLVTALAAPADAQEERGVVVEVKDDLATGLTVYTRGDVRYDRELEIYSKNFNHLGHTLTVEGVASTWPGTDLAKLTAAVKAWAGQQKTKAPEAPVEGAAPNASAPERLTEEVRKAWGAWAAAAREVHRTEGLLSQRAKEYSEPLNGFTSGAGDVQQIAEQAEHARQAAAKPLSLQTAQVAVRRHMAVLLPSGQRLDLAAEAAMADVGSIVRGLRENWYKLTVSYAALGLAWEAYRTARDAEQELRGSLLAALGTGSTPLAEATVLAAKKEVLDEAAFLDAFQAEWDPAAAHLSAQHDRLAKTAPGTAEGDEALKDLVAVVSELVQFANADPAQPRLVTTLAPEKTKGDDLTIKATARSRQDNAVVAEGSAKLAISGGLRVRLTSALVGTFGVADDDITIVQTPADPVAGTPATGRLLVDRVNFDFGDAQLVVFEPRQSREYCWGAAFGTNLLDGAARRYFVGPTFTYGRGDVRLTIPFGVVFGRVRGLANTINPAGNFAGVSESSLGRRDNQWKVGGYLGVGLGVEF